MVQSLKQILGSEALTNQEIYQTLVKSKNQNVSEIGLDDLLSKDLKVIEGSENLKVALASVSGLLSQDIFKSKDSLADLSKYCNNNQFSGVLILGIQNDQPNQLERDISIYFSNQDLLKKVRL